MKGANMVDYEIVRMIRVENARLVGEWYRQHSIHYRPNMTYSSRPRLKKVVLPESPGGNKVFDSMFA